MTTENIATSPASTRPSASGVSGRYRATMQADMERLRSLSLKDLRKEASVLLAGCPLGVWSRERVTEEVMIALYGQGRCATLLGW